MKKFLHPSCVALLLLLLCASTANAITRSELISLTKSLKGLKQAELKTAIFSCDLSQPDQVLSYGSGTNATWWGFWYTDRIASTNECRNRYSSSKFYFSSHNGNAVSGMNIEHSFPKSWWGGDKNQAYCDLFNLYPSESSANSAKGNYPMGVVTTLKSGDSTGEYDKVGTGTIDGQSGVNCWEPGTAWKGDFSRSYMYMATTYQNLSWAGTQGQQELQDSVWPTLKEWAYTLYLEWCANDPVSQIEVDRNNAIYEIQGNRNLYIDFPYLAEYVWGDSTDVAFNPETALTTAEDDNRFTIAGAADVSTPTFSPDGGTYSAAQSVTISCETSGVTLYYTIDGTNPTTASTVYSGAISVSESMTLKAIAVDADGNMSDVATAIYIISSSTATEEGDTTWLFHETFDQCEGTGGNDGSFSGNVASSTFTPDCDGWTTNKAYGGDRCARFGNSKAGNGACTTPTFTVNGSCTLTFVAAPWGSDGNTLTLSASNGTLSETTFTMTAGQWTTFSVTLVCDGATSITLTPTKRFFLDDIGAYVVTESAESVTASALLEVEVDGEKGYYGTCYVPFDAEIPDGVTCYKATERQDTLVLISPLEGYIPAETAFIIGSGSSAASEVVFTAATSSEAADVSGNLMQGAAEETIFNESGNTYYILTKDSTGRGGFFYQNTSYWADTDIASAAEGSAVICQPYKGVLVIGGSSSAKRLSLTFGNPVADGISSIERFSENAASAPIYDLQGRRVAHPRKGLYIQNGRKFVIK